MISFHPISLSSHHWQSPMFSSLLLPVFGLIGLVAAYSNPGACSGHCSAHDPSLIQRSSDKSWFRFNTGNGVGIWKATELAGPWTYVGDALASGSKIDHAGNKDLWVCLSSFFDLYLLYS